jgi:hypothetical protein
VEIDVTAGTDSHPDDSHVAAPGAVRQVTLPPAARALSTLSHIDYEDAFLVATGPAQDRNPVARALWAGIAPRHRQVGRDLLEQASCPERPPRQP